MGDANTDDEKERRQIAYLASMMLKFWIRGASVDQGEKMYRVAHNDQEREEGRGSTRVKGR